METPATPDPTDHTGPSAYEGWDPTPDPVGELDLPEAPGHAPGSAPGIAYDPGAARVPATIPADADEVTAMRERLAFYESFDSLIRDNIDRAGALLREAATKQVDAEVKLRANAKAYEAQQIEERTGYRRVFSALLDDVSTLQQQVERVARQVADALDDLELQLPAAGELSAVARGQALGMSGQALGIGGLAVSSPSGHAEPAELPSGASSAAWVTHDGGLHAGGTTPTTAPDGSTGASTVPEPEPDADPGPDPGVDPAADPAPVPGRASEPDAGPADEPIATDDLAVVEDAVVEDAAGAVDPEVVEDVLTEFTDADPAVTGAGELPPESAAMAELSDLPEEFGLSEPIAGAGPGVVDAPYVEQSEAPGDGEPDALDDDLGSSAQPDGFYVESTLASGDAGSTAAEVKDDAWRSPAVQDTVVDETPLRQAAPIAVTETDGGLDEEPVDQPDPEDVPEATGARASYGDQAPLESGIGSEPASAGNGGSGSATVPSGFGDPPTKLRRFEAAQPRTPAWGTTPPAPRIEASRAAPTASTPHGEPADVGAEQDTIVLVHGVPRATTALSLKRYLEGLAAVTTVEPREYAEGVLRLQVTGERPIRMADLSAWPDGSGLQEVTVRDDLVEIRLPG